MITLLATAALAQEPVADASIDVPLTAGAGTVYLAMWLGPDRGPMWEPRPWDPPGGIDTFSVDHTVESLENASDLVLYASMVGGLGVTAFDASPGLRDDRVLLYLEALSITGMTTEVIKAAADRPRPKTATEGVDEADDLLSFPSGHTSLSTAAAMATVRMMDLKHGFSTGQRFAAYGAVVAVGATAGTLRVTSGQHFPSDVITGFAIGASIGWLVPELHKPGRIATVDAGANGRMVFRVTFAI